MASKSDYLENKILEHVMSKTSFTMPANVYMALCGTIPTDADTGATLDEASYTGYARKEILDTDLGSASGGQIKNANAAIVFNACTALSDTIVGFAIVDASGTGAGNVLYWGTTTSKVIDVNNTPPTIAVNGLVINED